MQAITYLAQELGGLIFVYMGPQPAPLLPRPAAAAEAARTTRVGVGDPKQGNPGPDRLDFWIELMGSAHLIDHPIAAENLSSRDDLCRRPPADTAG